MRRKWSPPSKVFGVLAVVFALAAFVLVRGYAARARSVASVLGRPVAAVVAARTLPRGTVLDASMLRVRPFPSSYAPPGAARTIEAVTGRTLLAPIAEDEAVTSSRLAPKGVGPIGSLVPPGMRATSVPTSLPAGSITAGDHIDVLATFPGPHAHTETVASGLPVLRVMRTTTVSGGPDLGTATSSSSGAVVFVLASPDQTVELAYARAFADVSVALDGPEEVSATDRS